MRTLTPAYLEAAKAAGRYPNVKVVVENVGTLNGNNEILELHITKGATAKPEYFETMLALSAECRITVDRRRIADESDIVTGKTVKVYAAFNRPDGVETGSALIGTFYISSYDNSDAINGIITANDGVLYTGVDFNPEGLTYPVLISDMLSEAFSQSGITLSEVSLDIDPHVKRAPYKADEPVAENMQGAPYSCREIIARIAAMNLGALYMDENGEPKIVRYNSVGSAVVNNNMILDFRHGSENFGITAIRVFKTEERMAKTNTAYRKLPYSPRFENMDDIANGSDWHDEIEAAAPGIVNKPWTTGTLTIRGVGELEIGDIVTVNGTNLLISGITYDFVNACFNETLYSFAWTYEEYLMSHPPIANATGTQKQPQTFTDYADPILNALNVVRLGDTWHKSQSASSNVLEKIYKRVIDPNTGSEVWEEQSTVGGGSGGCGVSVGNHSEIYNYTNSSESGYNTINDGSVGRANRAGGYNNSITNSTFTDVYGIDCASRGDRATIIRGDNIDVGGSDSAAIVGESITTKNNGTYLGDIHYSIVAGLANNVWGEVLSSLIIGNGITIPQNVRVSQSMICGMHHTISTGYCCIIGGFGANVNQLTRLCIGDNGNVFHVDSSGDVLARSYNTNGADYAEMIEWKERLKAGEQRTGMLVALCGDRIIPAHGNEIVGIISAAASVIGNNPIYWHGKYKTDVFGAAVRDETGCAIISEKYDPGKEYILRSQRPEEWGIVGLTGRIVIVDDGSCMVGGYVSARHGIGTKCFAKTAVKVLRRIDESHVEVLIR